MTGSQFQQLDQERKRLIQMINLRFRNPQATLEQREEALRQLKEALDRLPSV